MRFNNRIYYFFLLTITMAGVVSCKKFIEVGLPENSISTEYVFADNTSAMAAVDGLYSNMANGSFGETGFVSGSVSLYAGMSADELYNFTQSARLNQFRDNMLLPNNSAVSGLWTSGYFYIYHANACIANLEDNSKIDDALRRRLLGEVKFIRAYCYLQMIQLFENIPLITSIDYAATSMLKNAGKAELYELVLSDLEDAQSLLPVDYKDMEKGRPNKWAAAALLARAYLYKGDWVNAELSSTQVIDNSGIYQLNEDPSLSFLKNNSEAIWQIAPGMPERNTPEGYAIIPVTLPVYVLKDELLAAFEPMDKRRTSWVGEQVYMGVSYFYPFKYKIREGSSVEEYITLLRFAEQYLIRAEARAQQNKLPGATNDINIIRDRAGLDPKNEYTDKADCLSGIEQERRIEFFAEQGHRWFDLKRWNRAGAVLSPLKPDWQPTDVLYPIPLTEINKSSLQQNQGYN